MASFDPYYNWLGISPHEQPANFYRLLGLVLFESNPDAIAQAADRQSMHVGSFQNGPNGNCCEQLMGEIGQAVACLLDPQQKASYDQYLQESLASRSERSVMSAPPPNGFGDFNGYGPTSYNQQPMQNGGWSNGAMPQPNAYGPPSGEMPLPQFSLPPVAGNPNMPEPMGFGPMAMPTGMGPTGMGPGNVSHGPNPGMMNPGVMNPQQPMPNFLPSPPAPIQASPMQARTMPQSAQPMPPPQPRMPQPAPFRKAQRPIPVATRAVAAASPVAAAPVTAPQPPPAAPPRPADDLESLTSSPIRRRFAKKKRNQVPTELIIGGVALAFGALGFVIYAVNGGGEKHGYDQITSPTPPVTNAADAALSEMKKALAAKDSGKKAESPTAANSDKRSRSITTVAEPPKRPKPIKPVAAPADSSPVDGSDDIVSPNKFGPPPHGADDASLRKLEGNNAAPNNAAPNNDAPKEVHARGPADTGDDPVMEDVIGGNPKK